MKLIKIMFVLIISFNILLSKSYAACGDSYNLSHHYITGKLDICSIEDELPNSIEILTNWGTKPEWIDSNTFVFVGNQIGEVYRMDIDSNTVEAITSHYRHSGYTRVHVLKNGDLLLLGPDNSTAINDDPLVIYDKGQFEANMSILQVPYDSLPIPLNTHAWEGIAVSTETNRIVWSDVNKPFFGNNIFETFINYTFGRSNLWTGIISYDGQNTPSLVNTRKIAYKYGGTLFEPQNFKGHNDEELLFTAYGATSEGLADTFIYSFETHRFKKILKKEASGYNEWEGIHPSYEKGFYERESNVNIFTGPVLVDLYMYDFKMKKSNLFAKFNREDGFGLHEPVFSPDGKWVLTTTLAKDGMEFKSPGYGLGIIRVNYEEWERNKIPLM
jgi:hypothetical protein